MRNMFHVKHFVLGGLYRLGIIETTGHSANGRQIVSRETIWRGRRQNRVPGSRESDPQEVSIKHVPSRSQIVSRETISARMAFVLPVQTTFVAKATRPPPLDLKRSSHQEPDMIAISTNCFT